MAPRKSSKTGTTKTNGNGEYKIVKSIESDSLNYVTKRFGEIVTEQMTEGWLPHGTPLVLIEDEKYIMVQAMINVAP